MCGICGVVGSPTPPLLSAMAGTLKHRGPDEEGFWSAGPAGLAFRRLAIIDLAGGHQPMTNENERYWLVFNGEIYNFQSLREELEQSGGHTFKSRSDTEVILHLYETFGPDGVSRLRGMFAFAIWDKQNQSLFLARDRFGKKPLYYAEVPNGIVFASEIRSILKHPDIRRDIDYASIDLYLTYQYIPSPRTIFKQIRKLPPAHTLFWKSGTSTVRRYWNPTFLPKTTLSFQDAAHAMLAKLKEATRLRMISDVPLGAFLSGGMDSSIIVGLMSELSSRPVQTFSIGFDEQVYSELPFARLVAKHFGCDHHEFVVKPDAVEVLPKLAWHYGEPFADSSALPSYYVSKMTRQHVTVALNGDGGDESFAGYPRYRAMKFYQAWHHSPRVVRQALYQIALRWSQWSGSVPGSPPSQMRRLLELGLKDPRTTYVDTLSFFREWQKPDLYSDFLKKEIGSQFAPDYVNQFVEEAKDLPGIEPYLYADQRTYLPECLMTKMDIASMANSLEARSPFLDHEFAELVASFPPEWKLKGLTHSKYIVHEAVRGWLPDEILARSKKGFAIPMNRWFRDKLRKYLEGMLLSEKAVSRGLFKAETIRRLLDENANGRMNHSYGLWAMLMLEHWFQLYIDRDVPSEPPQ